METPYHTSFKISPFHFYFCYFYYLFYNFENSNLQKKETLNEYDTVIYIDSSIKFKTDKFNSLIEASKDVGLISRYLPFYQNCFTDHAMYNWFNETSQTFDWIRSLEANFLIFTKTFLSSLIMKAWVSCAVEEECIAPKGSKSNCGQIENWYECSSEGFGCHRYDQSALTVITSFFYRIPLYSILNPAFGMTYFENYFHDLIRGSIPDTTYS